MSVYKELAQKLQAVAKGAAREAAPQLGRYRVTAVEPLTLEEVGGDALLEDGDPDFEVERWLRRYHEDVGLEVGDVVYVHDDGETAVAIGVAEGSS
jgi:hypothetical protein